MNNPETLIRNISDTARWVAIYRAMENERPDAHLKDPFARRLAGTRGEEIVRSSEFLQKLAWPYTARTWLIDKIIKEHIAQGYEMIINLAAGLDTRPYRMELPSSLLWVEIDLPGILSYKEEQLSGEKPRCRLDRIPLDLSDRRARNDVFEALSLKPVKTLILSEGLLIYLSPEEVRDLGHDLSHQGNFRRWALDLTSPGLKEMIAKNMDGMLENAGAPLRFAPTEGPGFFNTIGWNTVQINSIIKTARHLNRLSFGLKLMSYLPESNGRQGSRPWSAVCLFEKSFRE